MASTGSYFSEVEYATIQHIIDIPRDIELDHSNKCCIYRVPKNLREVKPETYTPRLISIGPLHHQMPLEQKWKYRYFYFFWKRVSKEQPFVDFKSFLTANIMEIRRCYSENFRFTNYDLVKQILLDSVFIMELFLRESQSDQYKNDDLINQSWLKKAVQRDLLLLENQLPIFIFEELYRKLDNPLDGQQGRSCFLDLSYKYFSNFDPQKSSNEMMEQKDWNKPKHFTDLIRCFHIPKDFDSNNASAPLEVLKTATKLHDAGVIFHAVPNRCSLDIKVEEKLCHASFQIPQFKIHYTTECVFRNLMALEQCHYPDLAIICSYISLLDNLINTDEDVDLLVDNEVIVHKLGSNEEVTTLINGLSKHIVIYKDFYSQHIKKLNERHRNCCNHAIAKLWIVYFKDLWRGSSTIVGLAVLLLTFIGFLRSILP